MDKKRIIKKANALETREDLLSLLSELKKAELGNKAYPFQLKQLTWYCNPDHIRRRYKKFSIPKKSGGVRHIVSPARGLMSLLTYVNQILQAMFEPCSQVVGFVKNRSIVTGAQKHINHRYVLNLDLTDFFTSIERGKVFYWLTQPPFNFNKEIANTLAGLCCMRMENEDHTYRYVLPQGSPASPIITNVVCQIMDKKLNGIAKRFNLTYTRYADDITFSGNEYVFSPKGEFWSELKRIISVNGFTINEKKTRLQKRGERQEVTGIIVSDRINVTRSYISDIRNLLFIWEKYGYDSAYKKFLPRYKKSKGYIKKGEPTMEGVVEGKLLYLKMVKGAASPIYVKLQGQYDRLVKQEDSKKQESKSSIDQRNTQTNKDLNLKDILIKAHIRAFLKDEMLKCEQGTIEYQTIESLLDHSIFGSSKKTKRPKREDVKSDLDAKLERLCNSDFDLSIL